MFTAFFPNSSHISLENCEVQRCVSNVWQVFKILESKFATCHQHAIPCRKSHDRGRNVSTRPILRNNREPLWPLIHPLPCFPAVGASCCRTVAADHLNDSAPLHCCSQTIITLNRAPKMPDAHAMDRRLQFMRLLVLTYLVPVFGKQLEVLKAEPAILMPALVTTCSRTVCCGSPEYKFARSRSLIDHCLSWSWMVWRASDRSTTNYDSTMANASSAFRDRRLVWPGSFCA